MQVSNILPLNANGKVQLSQPEVGGRYVGGSLVAVQTAKNPYSPDHLSPSALNVTVSVLLLVMMLHG